MSTAHELAVGIFGVDKVRPPGQPGEVTQGRTERETVWRDYEWTGLRYPAVRDEQTGIVRYWRDSESESAHWIVAPPLLASSFEPGPEWQADCDHVQTLPWRTCDTEADCRSLRREEARAAGGDWS